MAIDLKKIIQQLDTGNKASLPPVNQWHPDIEGEMDLVIDKQCQWFHEGGAFQRQSLVKLLSSVMRCDDECYYLVTPSEKMKITVADVPFLVVTLIEPDLEAGVFVAVTNTEDVIELNGLEQWQLREFDGIEIPYIHVRDNLWARLSRSVFYRMTELAHFNEVTGVITFNSAGINFPLGCALD